MFYGINYNIEESINVFPRGIYVVYNIKVNGAVCDVYMKYMKYNIEIISATSRNLLRDAILRVDTRFECDVPSNSYYINLYKRVRLQQRINMRKELLSTRLTLAPRSGIFTRIRSRRIVDYPKVIISVHLIRIVRCLFIFVSINEI